VNVTHLLSLFVLVCIVMCFVFLFYLLSYFLQNTDQCGDTIEKSQAPGDGCINVRNMLNIVEVKQNLINIDMKFVSYSSTITTMHGPIYIRL